MTLRRSCLAAGGLLALLTAVGVLPTRALARNLGGNRSKPPMSVVPSTSEGPAPSASPSIQCTAEPVDREPLPLVIVADGRSAATAAATVDEPRELKVIARYQMRDPAIVNYEIVPEPAGMKSRVEALATPTVAYVVLAVSSKPGQGQNLVTDLNSGAATFGDAAGAFVIDGTDPSGRQPGAIVDAYDMRVGKIEAPVVAVAVTSTGAAVQVDTPNRPRRRAEPVDKVDVLRNGDVVGTCAAALLPFTIPASAVREGDQIKVTANGAGLPPLTVPTGGDATNALIPPPPSEQLGTPAIVPGAQKARDGGLTRDNMLILLVAMVVGGGVVFFLMQRRTTGGAQPGVAGSSNDCGPPPPPSPHGPSSSPSAFTGLVPGGAGPPAPLAPVETGPDRRTEAPAFAALDLTDPAPGWTGAVPGDGAVRLADLGLMRLLPVDRPAGRTWSTASRALLATAGWLEKKPGQGEDAEPTLRVHASGRSIIGVYDGVGGAGSGTVRQLRDGTKVSGAYVGSRLARDLVESWYGSIVERQSVASKPDDLRDWLQAAFRDEAEFIPDDGMNLRGSLSRVLPTTLAAAAFGTVARNGRSTTVVDALWAGDSRAYLLTPDDGLQVLTVDDTRETDALELIRNDQPMDNLVSAATPFVVNHRQVRLAGPVVLITATDGCFGYVKTPAHFEYLILRALQSATSIDDWSAGLLDTLATFTGDDATFAIAASGFEDLAGARAAFRARLDFLDEEHWQPFEVAAGDPAATEASRDRSWAAYQSRYHQLVMNEE